MKHLKQCSHYHGRQDTVYKILFKKLEWNFVHHHLNGASQLFSFVYETNEIAAHVFIVSPSKQRHKKNTACPKVVDHFDVAMRFADAKCMSVYH